MSDGPIENYTYSPFVNRPGDKLGYSAVGPGWTTILKVLDGIMVSSVAHAVQHATVVKEEYKDKQCEADASINILQIKEKFGGLRVYWMAEGLGDRIWNQVGGAVTMAESMSYQTCEKCGSSKGADTRNQKGQKYGRILTLCEVCHDERDNIPPGEWFEFGNGDKTI
jgi:hypothetical protein